MNSKHPKGLSFVAVYLGPCGNLLFFWSPEVLFGRVFGTWSLGRLGPKKSAAWNFGGLENGVAEKIDSLNKDRPMLGAACVCNNGYRTDGCAARPLWSGERSDVGPHRQISGKSVGWSNCPCLAHVRLESGNRHQWAFQRGLHFFAGHYQV